MQKALKRKKIYACISVFSFFIATAGFILALITLKAPGYTLLIASSLVSAVFCYVTLFTAFAAYDASVMARILPVVLELGMDNSEQIAERIGWKPKATRKYIDKIKKHGYIM